MSETTDIMAMNYLLTLQDSDIRRFPEIQEASQGVLEAAAFLLASVSDAEPAEQEIVRAVSAFMAYYADESTFASDDQRFMDLADERGLSDGLMDRLNEEVTRYLIKKYRDRGNYVVDLRETRGWDPAVSGYYVFTKRAI
jgi:hypothetical protein